MQRPFTCLISAQELAESTTPSWRIFDCRFRLADPGFGKRAYAEGHLPGAMFLDLEEDLSGPVSGLNGRHPLPDPQLLAAKLGSLGVGPDTQVVAYDDMGGMFAARLWWLLRWLGHSRVAVLDGGLQAWASSGKPIDTAIPEPVACHFEAKLQRDMKVNADYVLSHLDDPEVLIIDARAPDRFRGENETLDPVGGHIPGAINIPHRTMNAETTSAIDRASTVVTYCDGIGCNASTKGAYNMARLGFKVKELIGGLDWWKRDGHPTEGGAACASTGASCGCS